MGETLIDGGTVVTVDQSRRVIDNGAVLIRDGTIAAVGTASTLRDEHDVATVIDAEGALVTPGFIDTHVHVPDILSRGVGKGRDLYDWLFNVKRPFVHGMTPEEHAIASALYCYETISAGTTCFVENAGGSGSGYRDEIIEAKLEVYDRAGIRNVYAHCFLDEPSTPELQEYIETQTRKEPAVNHVEEPLLETDAALERVETLLERHHGTADGRQQVWPGPFLARGVSPEGLRRSYELAEEYDVMTTTHTAESPLQQTQLSSNVEYLHSTSYLGERTLLGHCVQLSENDQRLLGKTGTKVAHNVATNLALAAGVAPVPELHRHGVTVGLGTDNPCVNDTTGPFSDLRLAALTHTGHRRDPAAVSAQTVLEMATIEAARAIGCEDELGSIAVGKQADLVIIDCERPNMVPVIDPVSTIVYQAQPSDISTVLCDGDVVYTDGAVPAIDRLYPDLFAEARSVSTTTLERAGLTELSEI